MKNFLIILLISISIIGCKPIHIDFTIQWQPWMGYILAFFGGIIVCVIILFKGIGDFFISLWNR